MMPTFRQQLVQRRALLGAVTLLCLLWHLLLPTMVHVGLVPALFIMPAHCQPVVVSHAHSEAGLGIAQGQSVVPASIGQGSNATSASDVFQSQHAHEVFALAAQIMKHCPLCSHGLDSGVLIPLIALLFVLLAHCFTVIRSLGYKWTKRLYIAQISFALPFKHGPPVIL